MLSEDTVDIKAHDYIDFTIKRSLCQTFQEYF